MNRQIQIIIALFLVACLVIVWYIDSNEGLVTAAQIKSETLDSSEEVASYSFTMDTTMTTTDESDGSQRQMSSVASGSVDLANNRFMMERTMATQMGSDPSEAKFSYYFVDDELYMNSLSQEAGEWVKMNIPGYSKLFSSYNYMDLQSELLEVSDVERLADEVVNGVECYVLKIVPDVNKYYEIMMKQQGADTTGITSSMDYSDIITSWMIKQWIAKDTHFLMKTYNKMTMEMNFIYSTPMTYEIEILFSDYNAAVDIELPEEAEDAQNWSSYTPSYPLEPTEPVSETPNEFVGTWVTEDDATYTFYANEIVEIPHEGYMVKGDRRGVSAIYFYGGAGVYNAVTVFFDNETVTPEIGEWNTLKMSYDGDYLKLYLNDELLGERYSPASQHAPQYSDAALILGNHRSGGGGYPPGSSADEFIGVIDNVKISELTGNATVAFYQFDEGSGNITFDSSGNNLHGSLVNGIWVNQSDNNTVLSFDRSENRYVIVEDSSVLDLEMFTISADFKLTSPMSTWPKGYQTIVSKEYQYILRFFREYSNSYYVNCGSYYGTYELKDGTMTLTYPDEQTVYSYEYSFSDADTTLTLTDVNSGLSTGFIRR